MKDSYIQKQHPMNSNTLSNLNAYQTQLVKSHLDLVSILAKSLLSKQTELYGLTESDLSSAGYEALISAACHYDNNRNVSFKTYANKCIWHSMVAEIERLFPSQTIETQDEKKKEFLFIYNKDFGSDLTVRVCCNWEAEQAWQLETLHEAIASLKPKEQFLIRCYYGFDNKAMKLEEIANVLNVTPQAVHKRLTRVHDKLRKLVMDSQPYYSMCA